MNVARGKRGTTGPLLRALLLGLALADSRKMAKGMSLFLRTGWLSTVPEAEWRAWFELVKRGRAEGPGSPYYVSELGLQTVACCNSPDNVRGCLGPKCTTLGVPPYTLFEDDISKLLEYLPLFDKVYVAEQPGPWLAG